MITLPRADAEKRTILLVIGSLQGGGAERQMSVMANYWVAKGWTVMMATWSGSEAADFFTLDSRVVRLSLSNPSGGRHVSRIRQNVERILRLRRLLVRTAPDVTLSFLTESNVLTILAAVGTGANVAVGERVHPALYTALPRSWRWLRRLLYARANTVAAQTEDAAQWLRRYCRTPVFVVPNALRDLPPATDEKSDLILAVGRLAHQKGFDLLLRAFAQIAARFPGWRLAIVGEGEDRGSLTRLSEELRVADRVELVGQSSDVDSWMARAGLVVQPSRFEGFPNVVLESMALGAAVISADCLSGPSVLIQDRVNGRLVPVEDVDGLAQAMAELLSGPDERVRLGREARRVRERYRQDIVMEQWEACLFRSTEQRAIASAVVGDVE